MKEITALLEENKDQFLQASKETNGPLFAVFYQDHLEVLETYQKGRGALAVCLSSQQALDNIEEMLRTLQKNKDVQSTVVFLRIIRQDNAETRITSGVGSLVLDQKFEVPAINAKGGIA